MSHFTGPLTLTANPDGKTWYVHSRFGFYSDRLGRLVTIPAGFQTDGASVPRLFWNLIPPFGKYGQAATVHDYLYRWQRTTRRQADDAFLEGMWVCNTSRLTLFVIWFAVRMFGQHAWAKDALNPLKDEDARWNC